MCVCVCGCICTYMYVCDIYPHPPCYKSHVANPTDDGFRSMHDITGGWRLVGSPSAQGGGFLDVRETAVLVQIGIWS